MNIPEYAILVIGYSSAALSMIYKFEEIYKLLKTKRGVDISVSMIIIQQISYILGILYGVIRNEYVYITTSSISFLHNVVIIFIRKRYLYNTIQNENNNFRIL